MLQSVVGPELIVWPSINLLVTSPTSRNLETTNMNTEPLHHGDLDGNSDLDESVLVARAINNTARNEAFKQ